jgi:RNA polymerase sigma-70 factor (ECF subfamily)
MEGIPQREIARRLGVSENVVENDVQKALRMIQRALRTTGEEEREEWKIDDQQKKVG